MGYESDPLPSHKYLRNQFYTINFKTTISSGSLYLPSHVLIPPPHKPTSYRHPLFPHAQLIYGPAGHLRRYGGLPPLDIFLFLLVYIFVWNQPIEDSYPWRKIILFQNMFTLFVLCICPLVATIFFVPKISIKRVSHCHNINSPSYNYL